MIDAASQVVIAKTGRKRKKKWITNEIFDLMDKRRLHKMEIKINR